MYTLRPVSPGPTCTNSRKSLLWIVIKSPNNCIHLFIESACFDQSISFPSIFYYCRNQYNTSILYLFTVFSNNLQACINTSRAAIFFYFVRPSPMSESRLNCWYTGCKNQHWWCWHSHVTFTLHFILKSRSNFRIPFFYFCPRSTTPFVSEFRDWIYHCHLRMHCVFRLWHQCRVLTAVSWQRASGMHATRDA